MLTVAILILIFFAIPTLWRIAWWCRREQWQYWNGEDCSATGLLPDPASRPDAGIYLLSARTSGLKGALASHSWIVIRKPGSRIYERYDKMGWGEVIWKDGFPADGLWFSNEPVIDQALEGPAAARLIPAVEAAIASYPFAVEGSYCAWPGPNSNSFIAHVLRAAPEIGRMPATAVGRDFHPRSMVGWHAGHRSFEVNLRGYLGLAVGRTHLEVRILGLVGGIDLSTRSVLVPAVGAMPLRLPGLPAFLKRRYEPAGWIDNEILD